MAKLTIMHDVDLETFLIFECPGCECRHYVNVLKGKEPCWEWNESFDKPTFKPSVRVHYGDNKFCHFYIKDGQILYLMDCYHSLKGQVIDLPEIE